MTIIHLVSMYSLNAMSGTPIYRQIVDQTCQLIASGRLPRGELLPSVRALAAELGINPMTVSKAYGLLEREGIVTRRHGLGMAVEETTITPAETIRPEALALVDAARRLRLSRQDVAVAIDLVWNPERKDP
ncbi:MAG: GntR family transcriptional regulator [Gammaproteobacteria bacterium]|nr:GntR family transcriptional regulator [Gammaproteobacteria bacterium]